MTGELSFTANGHNPPPSAASRPAFSPASLLFIALFGVVVGIVLGGLPFGGLSKIDGVGGWLESIAVFAFLLLLGAVLAAIVVWFWDLTAARLIGKESTSKLASAFIDLAMALAVVGVVASTWAWLGQGSQWRQAPLLAVADRVPTLRNWLDDRTAPIDQALPATQARTSAEGPGAGQDEPVKAGGALQTPVSSDQSLASDVVVPPVRQISDRPALEPFASCFDAWEAMPLEADSDGGYRYPFTGAWEMYQRWPACFHSKQFSYAFPRFPMGPNGRKTQQSFCLRVARKQFGEAFASQPESAVDSYLNLLAERYGVYCIDAAGKANFAIESDRRPALMDEAWCDRLALSRAKAYEGVDAMPSLCFNGDHSARFEVSHFAGVEVAKAAFLRGCANDFEPYAKALVEAPDLEQELRIRAAMSAFELDRSECFLGYGTHATPKFPLSGPYSSLPPIRELYERRARTN